jgi:hypothetical protein
MLSALVRLSNLIDKYPTLEYLRDNDYSTYNERDINILCDLIESN